MIDPNDDLDEILAPRQGQPSTELREELLRQIETRLVRQRWLRGCGRMGAIASIFLGGALTGWMVRPTPHHETVIVTQPEVVFIPVPVAIPVITPSENVSSGAPEIAQKLSGPQTEMQAELADDPKAAARLYKLAGDAFLRDQDYSNASRCYRLYLVRAGDTALSLEPDDSWLLTSLKNAAFQEKSHVSKADS
jgi:hypothetical protein